MMTTRAAEHLNPPSPSDDAVLDQRCQRTVNLRLPPVEAAPTPLRPTPALSTADPSSGKEGPLLGDYELLAELGRGGMGIVYKARHRLLGRLVALKVTLDGRLVSESDVQRFQLEASAAARLDHPNIVPIYEVGTVEGQRYLAMAFVDGGSLARALTAGPLPPRRAAALIRTAAAAVAYAHAHGVVHRDLKPDNILIDSADQPRITDFGIAKCLNADQTLTRAGEVIGTPSYMPPEQAQGHHAQVGPLADVYALGATLYCLLTGRPPFHSATAVETLKQVLEREPAEPRQLNPAVDHDLNTICLKCLEKAPKRRYASAQAVADDLQRFLEHRPIRARSVGPVGKAVRWCRRNPLAATAVACVGALMLTAFGLVLASSWRAEQALRQEAAQRQAAEEARQEEARQRQAADAARDAARRHEQAERWERYRAGMAAVVGAFQSHNAGLARSALEAAPEEHRNWEWRHFYQQLDTSLRVSPPHNSSVRQVVFDGDGLALSTGSGRLCLWDLRTGQDRIALPDLVDGEHPPAELSPDRRMLAYASRDGALTLWDVAANRRHAVLRGYEPKVAFCHFTADGKRLVTGSAANVVRVWDVATASELRSWEADTDLAGRVNFSATARQLLLGDVKDGSAHLWDLETGQKTAVLRGHEAPLIEVAFSPQGDRLLTSEGYPSNTMRLWNAADGRLIAVLRGHTNQAHTIAFSSDGTRIVSASFDQTIRLWEGRTGAHLATLQGHTGRVLSVAFSPDGKRLASASQDHTLRLWDVESGLSIAVLRGHTGEVREVMFSPDGACIASAASDRTIRLWDVRLAERNGVLRGHTGYVYGVAFHPDGNRVASAAWDGTVRLWDATTGAETARLPHGEKTIVSSVALHPGGRLLASLSRDNTVRLWDLTTGVRLHSWNVPTADWRDCRVTFSPDGNLLAAGACDGAVHLWDVNSRAEVAVLKGHRDPVHDVVFSPDGTWLASAAAADDKTICVWDVATKERLRVLEGHSNSVYALAVHANGRLLASGSADGTVRLWDTATWTEVAVLKQGTNVYGLAFHPDGTRLATGCADNTIRFWDVATRQEVAELRGHATYVHALAFSPDGTRLATASGDFTLRVWDTLSPRERAAVNR
jgi:WD40 repeat protein